MTPEADFRPDVPSTARMYDYYLGGKDNYPADRQAAERVIGMMPEGAIRAAAIHNRGFLGRAVRTLAGELGIRQFVDIGTGLPTMSNVHEVAQSAAPDSHIVYVDHDPIVLAHARDMLHGVDSTKIINHDLRDPAGIMADPELNALIDLSRPVAVLLVAILHFISDEEDPLGIISALMKPLPAGSYLVISHATADSITQLENATEVYKQATSSLHNRTQAEVEALFAGCDLLDPGVVRLAEWRPDAGEVAPDGPGGSLFWCGVGRKR